MFKGIIITYGPSLYDENKLTNIIKSGVKIIRFNFSHKNLESFDKAINIINNLKKKYRIKILADLQGNRIRVRNIFFPLNLINGKIVVLTQQNVKSSNKLISFDYPYSLDRLKKGMKIYIDDGNIELEVISVSKKDIKTLVKRGGELKNNKGINIPDANLYFPIINEKDKEDLEYIISKKFDYIALSFIRKSTEVVEIKKYIKSKMNTIPLIISKIENKQAISNIDSIIKHSDGIMVARGDLGVSIPQYKVPFFQKKIIKKAKEYKKFSIVATQIFDSMVENYKPTRAEVSDLANAIEDGANYIMFSAERSIGKYPLEVIEIAKKVIKYSIRYLRYGS